MQEFMLLFRNVGGNGQYISTPQDMQEDMPKWQQWIGSLAQQGQLVATQPIEYRGKVVSNGGVADGPYLEADQLAVGYLICKAASLDDAVALSQGCPVLKYPNASVEVRPILPFSA